MTLCSLLAFLIIYFFPKSGKFKYNFENGRPWQDIEEFSKYKYLIDDAFKNPNLDFFELVYKRYTKRMIESEKIFNDILSKPFDFNKDEVCECDFEELDYVNQKINYLIDGESF